MRGRGDKNDNHRHFNNMQRHSRLPRRASAATMALYNDKDTPGSAGCLSLDKRRGVRVILPDRNMFCPARTNVTDNVLLEPAAVKVKIAVAPKISSSKPSAEQPAEKEDDRYCWPPLVLVVSTEL